MVFYRVRILLKRPRHAYLGVMIRIQISLRVNIHLERSCVWDIRSQQAEATVKLSLPIIAGQQMQVFINCFEMNVSLDWARSMNPLTTPY